MTAAKLLADLRRVGVFLCTDADRLIFDAPAKTMTPQIIAMLKVCKPEMLAILSGNYLNAAAVLILRESEADQRSRVVHLFDERGGICEYDGRMNRPDAERAAYRELAKVVDSPRKGSENYD